MKHTLESFAAKPKLLRESPVIRGWTLYYVALESFSELSGRPGPQLVRTVPFVALYRLRHVLLALLLTGTGMVGYWAGRAAYEAGRVGWGYLAELYAPLPTLASPLIVRKPPRLDYPESRLGTVPEEVWLVESNEQEELWSNGLRVLTNYETRTDSRSFLLFPRNEAGEVEFQDKPVGIVYHTSEYDIAPFRSGFNEEILRTSRSLLRWIARRNLYNYFIDRFGQVYRLVVDSDIATHAGVSIWADGNYVYLNLSDSFLGVCFESRWNPQARGEDILTPAQIQAGLNLTDMLRAEYEISDVNCVPHGLISVNPKRMLIGYHTDWAKGFPFAALGLSDKYEVPLPSMTEFGFRYDEDLAQKLEGKLWPGVRLAEIELGRRAEKEGISVAALRKVLNRRYRQQLELLKLAKVEKTATVAADP